MSTITTRICDRCGNPMKYIGWTARIQNAFRKGKRVKITQYLDGNPDGYSYSERCYELCAECTEKLTAFLRGESIETQNAQ